MNALEKKREYNKRYRELHRDHINKLISERNHERYHNDLEYRRKTIENAKISVKKHRDILKEQNKKLDRNDL